MGRFSQSSSNLCLEKDYKVKEDKDDFKSPPNPAVFNIDKVTEGTMIDVMDFMSKWANAIVTKVEKDCIQVAVQGGLEMEIQKTEAKDVVAAFESKAGRCSPDKLRKLRNSVNEDKEEEKQEVITKKVNKGKRHQNNQPTPPPPVEEPEKPEVRIQNF